MKQVERLQNELEAKYKVSVKEFLELYKSNTSREAMASALGTTEWLIRIYSSTLNLRLPKKHRANDIALFHTRFSETANDVLAQELTVAADSLEYLSKELVAKDKAILKQRAEISRYKSALKAETVGDNYLSIIGQAISMIKPIETPTMAPQMANSFPRKKHTQWVLLSDLHFEELISSKDVGKANEFDWGVAESRLAKVFVELLESHNGEEMLIVIMAADMLSGIIHDTLESTTKPVAEAIADLASLLARHISTLSQHYHSIHVPCVHGNHGRISERKKATASGFNFEYLLYQIMKAQLANYTNITVDISTTGLITFPIGSRFAGVHHGDFFKAAGDTKFLRVKEAFRQTLGITPDHIVQGHTHKFLVEEMQGNGKYITNGSLTGVNGYCHTNGFLGLSWGQAIGTFTPEGLVENVRLVSA